VWVAAWPTLRIRVRVQYLYPSRTVVPDCGVTAKNVFSNMKCDVYLLYWIIKFRGLVICFVTDYEFHQNGLRFTEIWWHNDFQGVGCPPFWIFKIWNLWHPSVSMSYKLLRPVGPVAWFARGSCTQPECLGQRPTVWVKKSPLGDLTFFIFFKRFYNVNKHVRYGMTSPMTSFAE